MTQETAPKSTTRRHFLKVLAGSGLIVSTTMLPGLALAGQRFRPGLQLFTVRELMQQDARSTLQLIANLGYKELEFAGLFGHPASIVANWLADLGLNAPAGHTLLQPLLDAPTKVLEEALTLGGTLALMRGGRMEQIGAPQQIFQRPRNLFVAGFLQLPNLVHGEVKEMHSGKAFYINDVYIRDAAIPEGEAYGILSPDKLALSRSRQCSDEDSVVFRDRIVENRSGPREYSLRLGGDADIYVPGVFPESEWNEGEEVYVKILRDSIFLLPANDIVDRKH